ncbi:hypothetical protein HDE69_002622 [Pedobacter cryoconitis]|uniref:Uncharacterized protein n=1 Tax=Pedobacter cryoconitis TaxID=188932 RepID=A0A7W9DJU0_9SPHI|nr:hypothetical protein [Pedobacter cryoconitis]
MARCWYAYNGVGDIIVLASYNLAVVKPSCINGPRICAIYAPNCGPVPSILSTNMRNYIANAEILLVSQPDSTPGIKKYVYCKI